MSKDILTLAREAGIDFQCITGILGKETISTMGSQRLEKIERFAELVRADEREACAKVCEENATDLSEGDWDSACVNCADQIRNRSNT